MKIYNYNNEGYFTGESNAKIDPLESERQGKDVYLIPKNAVVDKVPAPEEGKLIRRVDDEWIKEEIISDEEEVVLTKEELLKIKVNDIKIQAAKRINIAYPEWQQRNYMAAVAEIHNKEIVAMKAVPFVAQYELTADELQIMRDADNCKSVITAIRVKSNELEDSLDSMTLDQLKAFDPTDDSNWS